MHVRQDPTSLSLTTELQTAAAAAAAGADLLIQSNHFKLTATNHNCSTEAASTEG